MTPSPDSSASELGGDHAAESDPAARRIPIGSQRAGSAPVKLPPRHRYVSPSAAPVADLKADTAPPSVVADDGAAESSSPVASGRRSDGERRDVRRREARGSAAKSSPADALPPARRVAVPSLRAALDDDLENDFAAAVAGVEIDTLLAGAAPLNAEAPFEAGSRVTGIVLSVTGDTAFIDLGGRRQGAMKLAGLDDADETAPVVGQVLELSIGVRNEEDGLYEVAAANHAVSIDDWSQLEAGMIVEARVTAVNKGGLECEVAGLRGFMPTSLVSPWRIENLSELVGQTLESLVTEIVPVARRLVLSRRAVIERQAADARLRMLETLEIGSSLDGIVRSVREFGAFVDIGNGVEGLVHVSQLSWDRVANPADVLQPGQKVRVVVKKIDRQTGKIGLSIRDLVESPWKHAGEKYHVGATVRGQVSRIAQFGAFVRLEPGVEGLVHVSEIASRHIRSVADAIKEGEEVECRVLAIDPGQQRLSLSIKALAAPASERPDRDEEPALAEPADAAQAVKKRTSPLRGGLGGQSAGDRFGLRW